MTKGDTSKATPQLPPPRSKVGPNWEEKAPFPWKHSRDGGGEGVPSHGCPHEGDKRGLRASHGRGHTASSHTEGKGKKPSSPSPSPF